MKTQSGFLELPYFINKTVAFKFRGIDLKFDLSPGLFSSAGVDTGTKLLLKVFSKIIDEDTAEGKPMPMRVLDAGCGTGIIGICAASALPTALSTLPQDNNDLLVRCQDRDELARLITLRNAAHNGIPPSMLEAYTEPLLAGPPEWDLIFTNIPAKTGTPVLEDFIRRSAGILNPGGRVIMVAVNTLADFFRERISVEAELEREEKGSGHTVFVYEPHTKAQRHEDENSSPLCAANHRFDVPSCDKIPTKAYSQSIDHPANFFELYPFYIRTTVTCPIENIPIRLETIHGAGGFDSPGGAVLAAAKLTANLIKSDRIKLQFPLLIHEPGQGFFPCWLNQFLKESHTKAPRHEGRRENSASLCAANQRFDVPPCEKIQTKEHAHSDYYLSGRNILALEAAAHNMASYSALHNGEACIVPAVDLQLGASALCEMAGGRQYGCIIAFPELLPRISPKTAKKSQNYDQLAALWDSLPPLLAEGGLFLAAFGSSDAERFDRKKPAGFSRLGSIKRDGFRSLAYRNMQIT
jgi:hypothetical protein